MNALARRLRLLPKLAPPQRKRGEWGPLSEPVIPSETDERMRAQSILSGPPVGQCPPLTLAQARDVLRWNGHA